MKLHRILLAFVLAIALINIGGMSAFAAPIANVPIEGSWVVTVSVSAPGFPPSFTALETYSRGGGLVTSNNLPPLPRPGQGTWSYKGGSYSATIIFFTFDSNGNQTGSSRVEHTFALTGDDEYAGNGIARFFDLNGNPIMTLPFTTSATRVGASS